MSTFPTPLTPLFSEAEVSALRPASTPLRDPLADMQERMQRSGQWHAGQTAGRRFAVACVSLEVTQRCNLDCTLCYLSDSSEEVRDVPLDELYRRIDLIHEHYGAGTDVQVSGGEPTLRRRDELVAVVRRLAARGLRASLFTNGIKATRALLVELARAGLTDVAFHVDMTQQRAGYASEAALNSLRRDYIERARGLPIGVFFNTTVFAGNLAELPMLAEFFKANADVVRFASFQLQAETGRGVLGARAEAINSDSVAERLQQGVGAPLRFGVLSAGHHDCNRAAVLLVVNGRAVDAFADSPFVQRFMRETAALRIDRGTPRQALGSLWRAAASRPRLMLAALAWAGRMVWSLRRELLAARGRVHKLTFFTHNFMDACSLDRERIDACVFMAITQDGPLSMCAYNARRDRYLLRPLAMAEGSWQPLRASSDAAPTFPIKWLKGRQRETWLREHRGGPSASALLAPETSP